MDDPPSSNEQTPRIELEPVVSVAIQRHIPESNRAASHESTEDQTRPIPERPAHRCPNCDYNLTGLTTRRCPECGEPFMLNDARIRGIEQSEGMVSQMKAIRREQAKTILGVALIAISFWMQNVTTGSVGGYLGLRMSYRGMVILSIQPFLFVGVWVYKNLLDRAWSESILIVGLLTATIGGVLLTF